MSRLLVNFTIVLAALFVAYYIYSFAKLRNENYQTKQDETKGILIKGKKGNKQKKSVKFQNDLESEEDMIASIDVNDLSLNSDVNSLENDDEEITEKYDRWEDYFDNKLVDEKALSRYKKKLDKNYDKYENSVSQYSLIEDEKLNLANQYYDVDPHRYQKQGDYNNMSVKDVYDQHMGF